MTKLKIHLDDYPLKYKVMFVKKLLSKEKARDFIKALENTPTKHLVARAFYCSKSNCFCSIGAFICKDGVCNPKLFYHKTRLTRCMELGISEYIYSRLIDINDHIVGSENTKAVMRKRWFAMRNLLREIAK